MLATFMMMPMVVAMISTQPINMARSLALLDGGFILSIVNDVKSPGGDQGDVDNFLNKSCFLSRSGCEVQPDVG